MHKIVKPEKTAFCICKNGCISFKWVTSKPDSDIVFSATYTVKFKIVRLYSHLHWSESSGFCLSWSNTQKTGFIIYRRYKYSSGLEDSLNMFSIEYHHKITFLGLPTKDGDTNWSAPLREIARCSKFGYLNL